MWRMKFIILSVIFALFIFFQVVNLYAQGSWEIIRQVDFETMYTDVDFVDKNNGWVVGWYVEDGIYERGLIIHTTDGGISWEYQKDKTEYALYAVDFVDSLHGWTVGYNGTVLHTKDGGKHWINQNVGSNAWIHDVCFADTLNGWVVAHHNNTIYHTTDGGNTWKFQYAEGAPEGFGSIYFVDSLCGWANAGNLITHTTDGGKNWITQYQCSDTVFFDFHFLNPRLGWMSGYSGKGFSITYYLFHTEDGGENWHDILIDKNIGVDHFFFIDSLQGWCLGSRVDTTYEWYFVPSAWHTSDGGKSWCLENIEMENGIWGSLCFVDSCNGWAVTAPRKGGYGVVFKYFCKTSNIRRQRIVDNTHVINFKLLQNYPNTFNSGTILCYFITNATKANISIYNINGCLIKKIMNNEMVSNGYHEIFWDGRNQYGELIASSIYFCKFESQDGSYQIEKLISIK